MASIDLAGQTAIVTGGGQGLGRASALALHTAGANVVINYFDDPDGHNRQRAEQAAAELGDRAMAAVGDVRDFAAIQRMIDDTIERFGSLDIIVNNAGILRDRTMKNMTLDEWQQVIDTNLTGVFKVCKAAAERMRDGGRIVNMSSLAGVVGIFGQSNYASAKAGVIALTKVLSRELAKRRIRVNAVAPGVVLTEMGETIPQESLDHMLAQVPLGRFGEASEIAHVVLFLASDLSIYMTGQTLHVNGGWWA